MKDPKDPKDPGTVDMFHTAAGIACPKVSEPYMTDKERGNILFNARWAAGMDYRLEATNRNQYRIGSLAWRTYEDEFRAMEEEYGK